MNSSRQTEKMTFEALSPQGNGDNGFFISLDMGEPEKSEFIPLDAVGEKYKETNGVRELFTEVQDKAALLEQEAYEKGFAQGEKDGLELGEKKATKTVEKIDSLLVEMGCLKEKMIKQSEKEILDIILAITEKVIHHQIGSTDKAINQTILNAVSFAAEKSKIGLRVNPEDYEFVEKLRPDLFKRFKELKTMTVTADVSVSRGGCFLETLYGDIDAGLEAQMEMIRQCLDESFNQEDDY